MKDFWFTKLEEELSKEKQPFGEGAKSLRVLYECLIEVGFRPGEALYLLGEMIKGGRK